MQPLPHLGPADFGRGRVLHQVVDGHAAVAAQPRGQVLNGHVNVQLQAIFGDAAFGGSHQVGGRHVHVGALVLDLVGAGHETVEDFERHRHQAGVCHPGAVVAIGGFTNFILPHLFQGRVVGGRVVFDGNLGGHAADGVHTPAVACLHHQRRVGGHEGHGHRDLGAVGQPEARVQAQALDIAENIVPAPAIEARTVLAQLVEDFMQLKSSRQRLNQHRGPHRALRHAHHPLAVLEHVIPQTSFEVAFEFGQVEVWGGAAIEQLVGVVEEVEAKVEQRAAHRLAVYFNVLFEQVPAAGPHHEHGGFLVQAVLFGGRAERNGAAHGIAQIKLALHHVGPGGRVRILQIGHEHAGPGV